MGITNIRGTQVIDESITRADLNATVTGSAVIKKLVVAGSTGILINASSGVDAGTGDVSLKVDESYLDGLYPRLSTSRAQNLFLATPASGGAGAASFRNITASDVPILNQNTTGSAGSAPAGSLTGTVLASNVVSSSLTSVGTLSSLAVTGGITSAGLGISGAYAGVTFAGGTNTASIYSDGANLIIANDAMIYLQSVTGSVLYAKGQKSGGDTWFEMMFNGSTKAKTVTGGFSVTGCGYFSSGVEVTGDVKATGDGYFFNSVSDMRLKTGFEAIDGKEALALVHRINPYWFTWKEGKKKGKRDFGFGAQEVEQVLPQMVQYRPDGTLGLYYEHYTAILSAALRYLSGRVDELSIELKALKNGQ